MTFLIDFIRKQIGWCPNANRMAIKTRAETSSAFGAGDRLVKNPGPAGSDRSGKPWGWEYEHTQRGTLIIAAVAAVILIIIASMIVFGPVWVTVIVAVIMILALAIFSTLTVSVQQDALRIWFGPIRLIRKSWPISEIASVTIPRVSSSSSATRTTLGSVMPRKLPEAISITHSLKNAF